MTVAIDHRTADDDEFIRQVIVQTSEMKEGFREHGHNPYALPENLVIQVYPAVWIRIVDLLAQRTVNRQ